MATTDMKTAKKPRVKSVIEMPTTDPAGPTTFATTLAAANPPLVASGSDFADVRDDDGAATAPVAAAEPVPPPASAAAAPEPTSSAAAAPEPTPSAAPAPEPTPSVAAAPESTKDIPMSDTYTTAADALKNGADAMKASMHTTTESAMASGKATFDQVASKSREAIEHGMKHVDEMAGMARGNVEAMLASSRAAAQGIEAIAREVADFSRKTFEETTAAARAMTTVKTPNELMALQNDFAKTQFDAAVAEMSKLSETMVKLMGEVFEPMQARAAVATDKLKAIITPGQ